jgi:hypothetical protein
LQLGTKPFRLFAADESATEYRVDEMRVGTSLVANRQAMELDDPRHDTLDDRAMSSEVTTVLDAAASDGRHDAPRSTLLPATAMIVGLVGVRFVRPPTRAIAAASPSDWYRTEGCSQHVAMMAVGPRQRQAEWCSMGVNDKVTLGAGLVAVGWVRAGGCAPFMDGPRLTGLGC